MIIKSISLRNFKSFGNNTQTVEFDTNSAHLILLSAENGGGKCLSPDTEIEIRVDDDKTMILLIDFLKNRNKPL